MKKITPGSFASYEDFVLWANKQGFKNAKFEVNYINGKNIFGQFEIDPEKLADVLEADSWAEVQNHLIGTPFKCSLASNEYGNYRLLSDGKCLWIAVVELPNALPAEALINLDFQIKAIFTDLLSVRKSTIVAVLQDMNPKK